jgi:diketogulonate reductase-like aldo/keto reductase
LEQRPIAPGVDVPVIGMGTWQTFDVRSADDQPRCTEIVEEALAAGVRVLDSSPMYGEAECVLGEALGDRRPEAFVATKIWTSSAEEGRSQAEQALRFYRGGVDLYQVHNLVAWRDQLALLEELRDSTTVVLATHDDEVAHAADAVVRVRDGRLVS